MALVQLNNSSSLADRIAAAAHSATRRVAQYRAYRRTLAELQSISGRDLADLGLDRSMLNSVAWEEAQRH
jgi:uncharacterized protein YjiS (DUF1127 family)